MSSFASSALFYERNLQLMEEKIANLWSWFVHNEQRVVQVVLDESSSDREEIIQQMDNFILSLGLFTWEISEGSEGWVLTISPNGDQELLEISRSIVSEAPAELYSWELNYCKPAKQWDRTLVLYDSNMDEQFIDASDWNFAAIPRAEDEFDVVFEHASTLHIDDDTLQKAGELIVTNEIGEERRIQFIGAIRVVQNLDDDLASKAQGIDSLNSVIPAG